MRHVIGAAILWLGLAAPAWGDYKGALTAYNLGNSAAAATQLQPLAAAGNDDAQALLARLFDLGSGVEQDYGLAALWAQKAATQGNAWAMAHLGALYRFGDGVEQSHTLSYVWYQLGELGGEAAAGKKRKELEKLLNPSERKEADALIEQSLSGPAS